MIPFSARFFLQNEDLGERRFQNVHHQCESSQTIGLLWTCNPAGEKHSVPDHYVSNYQKTFLMESKPGNGSIAKAFRPEMFFRIVIKYPPL